jgi:hypothetical protein
MRRGNARRLPGQLGVPGPAGGLQQPEGTDTLDKLGVEWKHCTRNGRPYSISVARRASVVLMDAHVGPKC